MVERRVLTVCSGNAGDERLALYSTAQNCMGGFFGERSCSSKMGGRGEQAEQGKNGGRAAELPSPLLCPAAPDQLPGKVT